MALISPFVDACATPDGIATFSAACPPRGKSAEPQPAPPNNAALGAAMSPKAPTPSLEKCPDTTARYHDFNHFVVTYRQTLTDLPYAAIFRRAGKLVDVDLNPPQP